MLKIKKAIITVSALVTILSTGLLTANAIYGSTEGDLYVSKHWVPVLKDSASGHTSTNYGHQETGFDTSKLWCSTSITAYNKNDSVSASCYSVSHHALEGKDHAEVSIRNIKSANGTHTGGSTGIGYQTKYSSWTD